MPFDSAMTNTVASGASSTAAMNSSEVVMKSQRTMACAQVRCPGRLLSPARLPAAVTARHQRATPTWRRRPQAWIRLIASSMTKEITSMTRPSAAAPW